MVTPLVSTAQLAAALERGAPITILDVRWALGGPPGIEDFRRGHLPGAQFVDLDAELAAPPGPGRHPLPEPFAFQAAMRSHGVSASRPVVVYDAATGMAAARAWWTLRYFGHPDVHVLDGGLAAWRAAGQPVTTAETPAEEGDFDAMPGFMPVLDAAAAARLAAQGILIDARAPERFRGEVEPVDAVAGHIPGARNVPAAGNNEADGRFLSPDQLRGRFAAVGAIPGVSVGAYCGSGVVAAQEVLALSVAGIDAALYVGSWSEWITDPARPIATGD
jgi:thiosulfate/3-mercaptopyruvate sulfurtransferase